MAAKPAGAGLTKAQEVLASLAPRVAPADMALLVEAVCFYDGNGYNGTSASNAMEHERKIVRLVAILRDLGYMGNAYDF